MSRRACLSATAFKEGFRRLYGLPVHAWLRQRRMEQAAELLMSYTVEDVVAAASRLEPAVVYRLTGGAC